MSQITTHILDLRLGRPAAGVSVLLERGSPSGWRELARGKTDADGRLRGLLPAGKKLPKGLYRIVFGTGPYFRGQGLKPFYPVVAVTFSAKKAEHHHVPLLLSPYGYSTYRGS